jgi:hypothetical protein
MANEPILISSGENPFYVYSNPSFAELSKTGPLLRFTANNRNKTIYVWEFNDGFHAHVSVGLQLEDKFNSFDFLRGHAGINDNGTYEMVGSDFLNSFVGKLSSKDKVFLRDLLNQEWIWVDDYLEVSEWIDSFKTRLGL